MNIKIMVASHKDVELPKDKIYFPVLVGSDRNYTGQTGFQPDNVGDNISSKNTNYNELTAIYWAWKNLKDVDVIGLDHYRRLFSRGHERKLSNALNTGDVENLLKKAPVILPKKRNYFIETIESHYLHSHYQDPLLATRAVIKESYPDYLAAFDNVMKHKSAHMFNMFIMEKSYFDDYCNWLFGVLFKVEKNIDISNYPPQEARVFGYLSEILMDVWVEANQIKYVECNWIQIGKRHMFQKAFVFLKRKFFTNVGHDKTHF